MNHPDRVIFIAGQRPPLASALRELAGDSLDVHEVTLNGYRCDDYVQRLKGSGVIIIHHHDFAGVLDLIRCVRSHDQRKPILFATAEQDGDLLLQAYTAGANDCLESAVSPELLLAKVRVWLRWHDAPP